MRQYAIAISLALLPLSLAGAEPLDTTKTLQEVVVTASNNPIGRNLIPYTVTTIGHEQLEATGKTELLSAISGRVPSLFVTERSIFGFGVSNGGSGGIKIRGVGGSPTNAVLMMVDGQPQFAGIYSHHVADIYGVGEVERVEVLRGPGSVLYGSNAMGGVINVITKDAKRDGFHASITEQYGSYNTWRSNIMATARFGKFSALVSADYDRTDGLQENSDFRQSSAYAKLGYRFSHRWNAQLDYDFMKFTGNDPIYPKLSKPESTDIYHQNVIRGAASFAVNNIYDRTNGTARIYYSYGNHFIDDPKHFHSLDDRFGMLLYQNAMLWKGATGTLGFDLNYYTGRIPISGGQPHKEGSKSTMSKKNVTEYSPYITLQQELLNGYLTLNAGLRIAMSNRFTTQAIPQGGFTVHPGKDWLIKASVAKGYRNPSFRELYLYKPANPNLEPENMVNYEVTVGKSWGQWFAFDITAFYSRGSNLIQTVAMQNVNTGHFYNKGIEISAHSNPIRNLVIRATYSYLHTSLKNLTGAPRNQYYFGVSYRPVQSLSLDVDMRGTGGLWIYENVARQSYALLNIGARWSATKWLDLMLNLNNITDAKYQIMYGYQMPGINVSGGFRLKI